jgi:hypothetical protein
MDHWRIETYADTELSVMTSELLLALLTTLVLSSNDRTFFSGACKLLLYLYSLACIDFSALDFHRYITTSHQHG